MGTLSMDPRLAGLPQAGHRFWLDPACPASSRDQHAKHATHPQVPR